MTSGTARKWLLSGAAAIVLTMAATALVATPVMAQDGQGQQGQGGQGQMGQGGPGGNDNAGQGQGGRPADAGEDEESDGRGPYYGQPGDDEEKGGKPVWAQEGIPEVELGRLSVIRSPDKVLDRALAEVVANFDEATMSYYYGLTAVEFAYVAETSWDTITVIDSPLENLALLTQLWTTGDVALPGVDVPEDTNLIELSAILIGVASDKTLPVSEDTVTALATIVGVQLTDGAVTSIAEKAEDVRLAVLAGHG